MTTIICSGVGYSERPSNLYFSHLAASGQEVAFHFFDIQPDFERMLLANLYPNTNLKLVIFPVERFTVVRRSTLFYSILKSKKFAKNRWCDIILINHICTSNALHLWNGPVAGVMPW